MQNQQQLFVRSHPVPHASQTFFFLTPSLTITTCKGLRLPSFSFRCQKFARNQVAEKAGGGKREGEGERSLDQNNRRSSPLTFGAEQ